MLKEQFYTIFGANDNMTFVMKEMVDEKGRTHSKEVVGFYYGKEPLSEEDMMNSKPKAV